MVHNLFFQISIILATTVGLSFIARFFKQPLLVAYMLAGVICGPLFLNLIQGNKEVYDVFANFGVVLLLFIVGLELNFSYLKKIGRVSTGIGLLQFILNVLSFFLLSTFFNLSYLGMIFISLAASFSSTIVVLKLLSNKQDEESVYGRHTIGLLLIQDIISISILVLISFFSDSSIHTAFDWLFLLKLLAVIVTLFVVIKYLLPRIVALVANSGEFLFIFTITWCFVVASLLSWSGLSLEIGAVIAGLSLSASKFRSEIASRIKPLRDFFIVMFFVMLGSLADFSHLDKVIVPALLLAGMAVFIKPLSLFFMFRLFKFTRRNSFLAALTSAPLSEFGFIIIFSAISLNYLNGHELSIFTIAAIISIIISSYLITYSYQLYNLFRPFFELFGADRYLQKEEKKEGYEVLIFGYHRTGWKIGEALKRENIKFAAVDFNPDNLDQLRHPDIKIFFGDASDVEFLQELSLEKTKVIVSTIPSPEDQLVLLDFVRRRYPKIMVICTLYNKKHLESLYEAGASYVILPHLLGGMWAADVISKGLLKKKSSWSHLRQVQKHDLIGSFGSKLVKVKK